MTRGFVIDTPDLDLDDQDLALLQNALDTNLLRSEGPNHLLDSTDLADLKAALTGSTACDSPNLKLATQSILGAISGGLSSSSSPSWVPADAKIYIDLVNDRAWTEADGIVAIDTLLGADANTVNYFAASGYDAGNVTADGYIGSNDLVLGGIGTLRTKVLGGSTFVMRVKQLDSSEGNNIVGLVSGSTLDALIVESYPGTNALTKLFSQNGDLNISVPDLLANNGSASVNCFAATISGTRAELAFNGSDAITGVIGTDDRPDPDPLNAVAFISTSAIQSITIYDPLPSTAGLSELSRIIPEDAKIHINLVQDWAWMEDAGYVTIDTLLGTDANTVDAWDVTSYDASKLTADGYAQADSEPVAFIGAARTKLIAGSTFRLKVKTPVNTLTTKLLFVADVSPWAAIEIDMGAGDNSFSASSWVGSYTATIPDIENAGATAINVLAATLTTSRVEFAANGSTASSAILTDAELPPSCPLVAVLIDSFGAPLQSITIYDALPSTAGLSALSETGVTNTAPTGITIPNGSWTGGNHNGTYTTNQLASSPNAIVQGVSSAFRLSDPEGNPLVSLTMVDDGVGQFSMHDDTLFSDIDPSPGTYNFTLRATDPGGLYVEQQFTITVTA